MTGNKDSSAALIKLSNALALRISAVAKDGRLIDVGVKLSRIAAQNLAGALLDYADPICRRKEPDISVIGEYNPKITAKGVVRLNTVCVPAPRKTEGGR